MRLNHGWCAVQYEVLVRQKVALVNAQTNNPAFIFIFGFNNTIKLACMTRGRESTFMKI